MCDPVSLPSVIAAALRNQTELARILADQGTHDTTQRAALVASCERNQALFYEFVAKYQISVAPRPKAPARCSGASA
jgi:hypothetical protein